MSGDKQPNNPYVDRVIERARQLRESDAFAPPSRQDRGLISFAQTKATSAMHRRNSKHVAVAILLAAVLVVAISLCLPYYGINIQNSTSGYFGPGDVISAYALWFRLNVFPLFNPALASDNATLLMQFSQAHGAGTYELVINRFVVTVLVILCGIMLAVSGMLFQTSFKNPLAAPTMLGVSDGVTLGGIIYCLLGYDAISGNAGLYALLVYGLGAVVVIVVLLGSRLLSGGRRYSVIDMLLLGTVICQLIGGVNQFIQNFVMGDDAWSNFYSIQQASDALTVPLLQVLVVGLFLLTFSVVIILRFKFNLIAFSDDEGAMMGVRSGLLRALALLLGSLMELVALASVGQVAMLSMAVPFLVRYLMPADFRSQLLGNCLVGSLLLLICMVLQHFIVIGFITIPLGAIVSVAIVPFFVWVIAFSHGKWS